MIQQTTIFETPANAAPQASLPAKNKSLEFQEYAAMVARIQAGDGAGYEQLYRVLNRGLRYSLVRQLGPQDMEDKLHDVLLIVITAIRRGQLREPARLMGFVRTVAQRRVIQDIEQAVYTRQKEIILEPGTELADKNQDPEKAMISRERIEIMKSALAHMPPRQREILERFYLREQTAEQICAEMSLTETQFRLMKSRAKAEFGSIGQRHIAASSRLRSQKPRLLPVTRAGQGYAASKAGSRNTVKDRAAVPF